MGQGTQGMVTGQDCLLFGVLLISLGVNLDLLVIVINKILFVRHYSRVGSKEPERELSTVATLEFDSASWRSLCSFEIG